MSEINAHVHERPQPDRSDPLNARFWLLVAEGHLSFQRCDGCGAWRYPPADRCPECWRPGGTWQAVQSRGTVWSFTVYHRALHPAFQSAVPYSVAMIELEGGIRIPGFVEAGSRDALEIGSRLEPVYGSEPHGSLSLSWRVVAPSGPR